MGNVSKVIKKPKHKFLLNGYLVNDLEYVDAGRLRDKISEQARFSILYITLLITSVLVCTLGLLTDSTAIVIGGMLIAPLMWPLARLGFGIAHRAPKHLYRGLGLVVVSVIVGAASAYIITAISPIKVINGEILARTSPTLMDLFIALAAGLVAAIAITQKKIADSLAGVAIAVSLMPPLCTVGIALSLRNVPYSLGALLLFTVNAACITLVTTLVFIWTQTARKERVHIAKKAAIANIVVVLLLAIPLVQFLRSYSFELQSYGVITSQMNDFIDRKDPTAAFENINIEQADRSTIAVSADLLLPTDISFTYEDNELLVKQLENELQKNVLLNLRIQEIIEPISKDQRDNEVFISSLSGRLSEELSKLDSSYKINSVSVAEGEAGGWVISAEVLTNPDAVPTTTTVTELSKLLSEEYDEQINVNLTFLPRLTLRSDVQTKTEETQKTIQDITASRNLEAKVSDLILNETDNQYTVSYTLTTNVPDQFAQDYLDQLKNTLQAQLTAPTTIRVRIVQTTDISI